jgi:hypothetical protein
MHLKPEIQYSVLSWILAFQFSSPMAERHDTQNQKVEQMRRRNIDQAQCFDAEAQPVIKQQPLESRICALDNGYNTDCRSSSSEFLINRCFTTLFLRESQSHSRLW